MYTKEYVTCAKCGKPVHIHMFWLGNDNKKYHFNHLPEDRKKEIAELGYVEDNGITLLAVVAQLELQRER